MSSTSKRWPRPGQHGLTGALVGIVLVCGAGPPLPAQQTNPSTVHPDWHPDGRSLLVAHAESGNEEKLHQVDLQGRILQSFSFGEWRETYPAWAPSGDHFAFITFVRERPEGGRFVISIARLEHRTSARVIVDDGSCFEPRFSPDGELLAYTVVRDGRRGIAIRHLATGSEQIVIEGRGVGYPVFAPDGQSIVYNTLRRASDSTEPFAAIERLDLETGERTLLVAVEGNAHYADISPDGREVVYMSDLADPGERSAREIYLRNLATGETTRLTTDDQRDGYPRYSHDGQWIAWHREIRHREIDRGSRTSAGLGIAIWSRDRATYRVLSVAPD